MKIAYNINKISPLDEIKRILGDKWPLTPLTKEEEERMWKQSLLDLEAEIKLLKEKLAKKKSCLKA